MSMKSDLKEKLSQIRSRPIQVTVDGPVSKKYVEVSKATVDSTANKDVCVDPEVNGSVNSTAAENEGEDPMSCTVPDPDFHDFDKDRTEECFQSDQIWPSYDDDDGMLRFLDMYCPSPEIPAGMETNASFPFPY